MITFHDFVKIHISFCRLQGIMPSIKVLNSYVGTKFTSKANTPTNEASRIYGVGEHQQAGVKPLVNYNF